MESAQEFYSQSDSQSDLQFNGFENAGSFNVLHCGKQKKGQNVWLAWN